MKLGEDILVNKHVKNKWRRAWLEERVGDGKPLRSWCQKLHEPGASFCEGTLTHTGFFAQFMRSNTPVVCWKLQPQLT